MGLKKVIGSQTDCGSLLSRMQLLLPILGVADAHHLSPRVPLEQPPTLICPAACSFHL